jgi:hypothetical protein
MGNVNAWERRVDCSLYKDWGVWSSHFHFNLINFLLIIWLKVKTKWWLLLILLIIIMSK